MSRRGMPPVTDALLKVDMINQRPARKSLVQVRSRSKDTLVVGMAKHLRRRAI